MRGPALTCTKYMRYFLCPNTSKLTTTTASHPPFTALTGKMALSEDVDLEVFVMSKDDLSGADIKAVCTEAGLLALRERRMRVCQEDFVKAKEKTLYRKKGNIPEGLYL